MRELRCLLVTGIYPPDIGGPASSVPRLARELRARGVRVRVLALADTDAGDDDVVRVRRAGNAVHRQVRVAAAIAREARHADVVFANGLHWQTAAACSLARRPFVAKVVGDEAWERATVRGWTRAGLVEFQAEARARPGLRALRRLQRLGLARARRILVPSRFMASLVRAWGDLPPVEVVPNAVDAPAPAPCPVDLPGRRNLATACRLIPLKRVDALVRLVARLDDDVGLVVLGDGSERAALERLASILGVASRVRFVGAVPSDAVLATVRACDAFVLNSTVENHPHVLLEAMAVGTPVVATQVGGVPEIVHDGTNGLLVPSGDEDALQDAVHRVLHDPALADALASAGRKTAAAHAWDAHADRVLACLQEACA